MKGIAFDLEGTIIDVEAAHHQGHLATARELGIDLTLAQAIAEIPAFVGGPDRDIAVELQRRAGETPPLAWILERMHTHYLELVATMPIAPRDDFLAFLEHARAHGLRTAIGTVTPRAEARRLLSAAGMVDCFDILVYGEDVAHPKPAPDVYQETATRMGLTPADQLVFEDSARGVVAARAAGSRAIAVPTVHTPAYIDRLRQAGATAVFRHWHEVVL